MDIVDVFDDVAGSDVAYASAPGEAMGADAAPESFLDSLVSTFMPSAQGDQTANMNAGGPAESLKGAFQQSAWKPEAKLDNTKVAQGVQQSNDTANAMNVEAKEGLANIAGLEKDMKQSAAPEQGAGDSGGLSVSGLGRGAMFEAAAAGAVGLLAGPGAAALLGGAMLARDALQTAGSAVSMGSDPRTMQGPSPKTIELRGEDAREFKRSGYMPSESRPSAPGNSFEAQAGIGENSNQMFDFLSKGPGFGADPRELEGRSNLVSEGLDGIDQITMKNSNEAMTMHDHINEAKAGFERQLHMSEDLQQGLDARRDGIEVSSANELEHVNAGNAQMSSTMNTAFVMGA